MARTRTGLSTLSQRRRAVCSAADDHLRLKYNRRLVYTHTHTHDASFMRCCVYCSYASF